MVFELVDLPKHIFFVFFGLVPPLFHLSHLDFRLLQLLLQSHDCLLVGLVLAQL